MLSNGAVRGRIVEIQRDHVRLEASWVAVDGFFRGATARFLGDGRTIEIEDSSRSGWLSVSLASVSHLGETAIGETLELFGGTARPVRTTTASRRRSWPCGWPSACRSISLSRRSNSAWRPPVAPMRCSRGGERAWPSSSPQDSPTCSRSVARSAPTFSLSRRASRARCTRRSSKSANDLPPTARCSEHWTNRPSAATPADCVPPVTTARRSP